MRHRTAAGLLGTLVCLGLLAAATLASGEDQLDLNRASLEEIKKLPISDEDAYTIWWHKEYHTFYTSIYDLRDLDGISQQEIDLLKPLVRIVPVPVEDEELQRVNEIYYRIRQ